MRGDIGGSAAEPVGPALSAFVVCDSPVYGGGLRVCIEAAEEGVACTLLAGHELADPPSIPPGGSVVLAPLYWEEMRDWAPLLAKKLAAHPWVLLADLRVVGMFLWFLEGRRCELVGATARPEELIRALRAAALGRPRCPPGALPLLLARHGPAVPPRLIAPSPSNRQVQVGCALAMGLSNTQIAGLMCLGHGTVKTHVHHLIEELECQGRCDVGEYFRRALSAVAERLYTGEGARARADYPLHRKAAWVPSLTARSGAAQARSREETVSWHEQAIVEP